MRAYACYSPDGEMAASAIELHKPGGRALGWLAGTKTAYLSSGVSQHLYAYIFDDLAAAGALQISIVRNQTAHPHCAFAAAIEKIFAPPKS